jgi:protein-disulfide isomerase
MARKAMHWSGVVVSLLVMVAAGLGQEGSEVVAEVNGVKITRQELETKESSKLLQVLYQSYAVEEGALEDLIDQQLLALEAARQQVSVAQLEAREIDAKVKDPSEAQLRMYYEDAITDEPYAAVRGKILSELHQRRRAKVRAAYLQQLRERYPVVVRLAPPVEAVTAGAAPRLGSAQAPVQVIEFGDFQCPYCIKVFPEVQRLHAEFGEQVAIYFKDMPLPIHAYAEQAAEASHCAEAQGKYWAYHDLLFSGRGLEEKQLKQYARELKLDEGQFAACLEQGKEAGVVEKSLAEARQLGLTGTPSFFINGHFLSGSVDYAALRGMVEQALRSKQAAGGTVLGAKAGALAKR